MVHSKNKGKSFELKISHMIKGYGFFARRGQQFKGTEDSPDIVSELPFNFECKAVENLNLYKAYEQAKGDCGEHEVPCVVWKKNRKDIMISLEFSEFMGIMAWLKEKGIVDEFKGYITSRKERRVGSRSRDESLGDDEGEIAGDSTSEFGGNLL